MKTIDGKIKSISLKELYLQVYSKVFCIDNIKNLEQEEFREITETQSKYFVSNKGRVKSYCKYNAIIMKQTISDKGYAKVQIIQNGKPYNKFVHTLVAAAFPEECGKPLDNTWQVHHIDFDQRNNCSYNLRWKSLAEHTKIHNERSKKNE